MELTTEQALQQGIAAHNSGNLQEAERAYRSILQSQPKHPDANHNLGLIAISANQIEAALPLFKTALDVNPNIEQFWMSYIDALVRNQQLDEAERTIDEVKNRGFDSKKIRELLSQSKKTADTDVPAQEQLDTLLGLYQTGRFADAEKFANSITEKFPTHQFSWNLLGAIFGQTSRYSEALVANQKALALSPKDARAHYNLGITLKSLGRLAECESSFTRAIKLDPNFIEAHNNLGVILQELGKLEEAEATCKQAIEMNPDFVEAHYNLGVTLKALGRFGEAEASYRRAIALQPEYADAHNNLGAILLDLGRLDEAEESCKQALAQNPGLAEAYTNLGNALQEGGKLKEAEANYRQAIALKPDHAEAHSNLGVTLLDLGRLDEAEESCKQAIAQNPNLSDAYTNLGNTLKELGRLDEAEVCCAQAIALKPDHAEAHYNAGITLQALGRLDDAESSYRQAIALKPDYANAHNNLGNTLQGLGRFDEALVSYNQAIALKPDYADAYINLGVSLKNVKFNSPNPKFYPLLIELLTAENFARPNDVAPSILSLLKHDIQIKGFLLKKNPAASLKEATSIIGSLHKLPLLHHLMRVCPLPELQFEELFVKVRSSLLKNLDKMEVSSELIYFLSTLSIHCFTNEYVYIESDEEANLIGKLHAEISQTLSQSEQPEVIKILCLASYRSLHQYDWCEKLECLDNLEEVKRRLIEEPRLEKMIAKDIPALEEISDEVSLKVREQYEESPYPRWVKLRALTKAKPISAVCDELKLKLSSENIKNVTAPFILIAGCGTGQHSIGAASRFSKCDVTAVDLSLSSLAYAKRKTDEFGFTNIDYLQADILNLRKMDKEFDIIESAGVLHHMDEPMAGWNVLVDLLKPGGLMKIGLYSELARQHIVEVRKEIASLGLGTSAAEIRNFRELIRASEIHDVKRLCESSDFFSLSEFRDLVFHVQEHRFTLPQIKNCLDDLGLKFCGFENGDVISDFRAFHRNKADIYDLELWHQYEENYPRTFAGMYQFWCQKTLS